MCTKECAHEHTGSAETLRPSPRNGFTAYSVLSLATGFLATIALRASPQNLTPASGRRNHTSSPYAQATLVSRSLRVHRIPPRVRDVRTPLSSGETGVVKPVICPTAEGGIFLREGLDRFLLICPTGQIRERVYLYRRRFDPAWTPEFRGVDGVRFGPHSGLESDTTALSKSAHKPTFAYG